VNFATEWGRIDGRVCRILEVVEAFDVAGQPMPGPDSLECAACQSIEVQGLDLVAPRGQSLATGLSFDLQAGMPMIITGPNASGKSLLGGTLLGLWPASGGCTSISLQPGSHAVTGARLPLDFLMPATQRVYLPAGNLGNQVCYPETYMMASAEGSSPGEEKMLEAMRAAGIEHILTREPLRWIAEHAWEDVLSGGEQQRLCLARVLRRRPRFALLDECTSMIASNAEEGLYKTLVKDFGITAVTLTQRAFMPDLYRRELRLGLATTEGWSLSELKASS